MKLLEVLQKHMEVPVQRELEFERDFERDLERDLEPMHWTLKV